MTWASTLPQTCTTVMYTTIRKLHYRRSMQPLGQSSDSRKGGGGRWGGGAFAPCALAISAAISPISLSSWSSVCVCAAWCLLVG